MNQRLQAALLLTLSIALIMLFLFHQTESSKRATCSALLGQLEGALSNYRADNNGLPPNLGLLTGRQGLSTAHALDPWNHPLVYRVRPGAGFIPLKDAIELYSIGPNGVDEGGKGDDITNED